MKIRYAKDMDMELFIEHEKHISKEEVRNAIQRHRIYLAEENSRFVGWLRYNLFWDSIPFMNLLYILDQERGKGFGRQLVAFWEKDMLRQGYETLLTSTQSNEYAQHFYFRLGYQAIGGFRLEGECYEVIFSKNLSPQKKRDSVSCKSQQQEDTENSQKILALPLDEC